jgi:endoglucanase
LQRWRAFSVVAFLLLGCGAKPAPSGVSVDAAPAADAPAGGSQAEAGGAIPDAGRPDANYPDLPPVPDAAEPTLPLSTCGRWIVDRAGRRLKLAGVNWYGASDTKLVVGGLDKVPMAQVVATIRRLGLNSVRLPFSNEMLHAAAVPAGALAANPALLGKTPLEVYDATVEALTAAGILVLLNNHSTHAMWCCNYDDDGLWYTADYSEEMWIKDWEAMADRYARNPRVVAADLRNELRIAKPVSGILPRFPSWGGGGETDWRAAAIRAGNRVLARNPNLLIVVEGINSGEDLSAAGANPVVLSVKNRVVYSAHQYAFFRPGIPAIPGGGGNYESMSAAELADTSRRQWGYLAEPGQPYTAPVWLGEFGVGASADPKWLTNLAAYLRDTDADWSWWALNGGPKAAGGDEPFGLLDDDWTTVRNDWRLVALQSIVKATRAAEPACATPGL